LPLSFDTLNLLYQRLYMRSHNISSRQAVLATSSLRCAPKKSDSENLDETVKTKAGPPPDRSLRYWAVNSPQRLTGCDQCVGKRSRGVEESGDDLFEWYTTHIVQLGPVDPHESCSHIAQVRVVSTLSLAFKLPVKSSRPPEYEFSVQLSQS
jgi:hypothetical protein